MPTRPEQGIKVPGQVLMIGPRWWSVHLRQPAGVLRRRQGERWLIADRRIEVEWYGSPSWYESVRLKPAATKKG